MKGTKESVNHEIEKKKEITPSEQERKQKEKKSKWNLKDLWDYNKRTKIYIIVVIEGEGIEGKAEKSYSKK